MEPTKTENFKTSYPAICGDCLGAGRVWKETVRQHNYDDGHWEQCSLCSGSGMVTVTKETKVTITPKIPC